MAKLDPLHDFLRLFARAIKSNLREPTAMTLSTADKSGRPLGRMVLLKNADDRGFVFYTNFRSRKGRHLLSNPRATLCFYWPPLKKQILVEGTVAPVSSDEADAYWATRARTSQIGAWASLQSQPLPGRPFLLKRVAHFALKFSGQKIPRPPHWSGFRLSPNRYEFLSLTLFRLHDRRVFVKSRGAWTAGLLYP